MPVGEQQRLFIGLAVPDDVRERLLGRMEEWRRRFPFSRWVHPDDWHITLHFIGETDADRVPAIVRALNETAANARPFEVRLRGLGTFGPPSRPSVLHMLPDGRHEPLRALHAELGAALGRAIRFTPDERPYRPHLTLARKYAGAAAWDPARAASETFAASWLAPDVCLFRSRLGRSPMYEILHRAPFGG
jgi:2'-5' RNA ligase